MVYTVQSVQTSLNPQSSRVSEFLAGRLNWFPPPPSPQASVRRLHLDPVGGGGTLACGGEGGRSQLRRRDGHYGTVYTNPFSLSKTKSIHFRPAA
jgi:hypothetical protein